MLEIPGFGNAIKANLLRTLAAGDLVHIFCAGCVLKSTVTTFSSFSEKSPDILKILL